MPTKASSLRGGDRLQNRLTGEVRSEIDGVLADLARQLRLSETTDGTFHASLDRDDPNTKGSVTSVEDA